VWRAYPTNLLLVAIDLEALMVYVRASSNVVGPTMTALLVNVVTLLKVSSLLFFRIPPRCRTWRHFRCCYPSWGYHFGTHAGWRGPKVVRRGFFCIQDCEVHGAAQKGLNGESEMMDTRRAVAVPGVMKGLTRSLHRPCSEDGFA
jgi:hypothetical protein